MMTFAGGWWSALRRSLRGVRTGTITDHAAALTYYGLLSIFPALLVLVSVLGLISGPASGLNDIIATIAPGQVGDFISGVIDQVSGSRPTAGLAAVIGLIVAFWSASGYVAAFARALEDMRGPEHQSARRALPMRVLLTAALGILLILCVFLVTFTGDLARRAGEAAGVGDVGVTVWNIAKWPVLIVLLALLLALLYRAAPQRGHRQRWLTAGSLTAVLLWILVSALFGVYLATFASYQRTYGALSSVIVFLVWLWLSNIVVLIGAQLDAEMQRSTAGEPPSAVDKK